MTRVEFMFPNYTITPPGVLISESEWTLENLGLRTGVGLDDSVVETPTPDSQPKLFGKSTKTKYVFKLLMFI